MQTFTTIHQDSVSALYESMLTYESTLTEESYTSKTWLRNALKVWERFAYMTPDEFGKWNTINLERKAAALEKRAYSATNAGALKGQAHAYLMMAIKCWM